MPFIEHDLKTLLADMPQPFIQSEIKTIMLQLLRGVSHCHANWIVCCFPLSLRVQSCMHLLLMSSFTGTSKLPICSLPTAASSRSPTLALRAGLATPCPT